MLCPLTQKPPQVRTAEAFNQVPIHSSEPHKVMEDSKPYVVTMLVTPPTTPLRSLTELTPVAHTTEAGQQVYYKAEQVEQLLRADQEIIGGHSRANEALRQYVDKLLSELLADPTLPASIQKRLYAHRQVLIVASEQADV
jgi:hypothetical protein